VFVGSDLHDITVLCQKAKVWTMCGIKSAYRHVCAHTVEMDIRPVLTTSSESGKISHHKCQRESCKRSHSSDSDEQHL